MLKLLNLLFHFIVPPLYLHDSRSRALRNGCPRQSLFSTHWNYKYHELKSIKTVYRIESNAASYKGSFYIQQKSITSIYFARIQCSNLCQLGQVARSWHLHKWDPKCEAFLAGLPKKYTTAKSAKCALEVFQNLIDSEHVHIWPPYVGFKTHPA
jgi:hypothetical protein